MRMLPSHGWVGGLFGRRDRALLTLTATTAVPYRQMASMPLGQIHVADGAATVTDTRGTTDIAADADPVLCGPCALYARWSGRTSTSTMRCHRANANNHFRSTRTRPG